MTLKVVICTRRESNSDHLVGHHGCRRTIDHAFHWLFYVWLSEGRSSDDNLGEKDRRRLSTTGKEVQGTKCIRSCITSLDHDHICVVKKETRSKDKSRVDDPSPSSPCMYYQNHVIYPKPYYFPARPSVGRDCNPLNRQVQLKRWSSLRLQQEPQQPTRSRFQWPCR